MAISVHNGSVEHRHCLPFNVARPQLNGKQINEKHIIFICDYGIRRPGCAK